MAFVVFVQRTQEISKGYSEWVKEQGHHFWSCEGPEEELGTDCDLQQTGGCSLWDLGGVFIYDPNLDSKHESASTQDLVMALRQRYADKPMILMGPDPNPPAWAVKLANEDPHIKGVFPAEREAFRAAMADLGVPHGKTAEEEPAAEPEKKPGERFERLSPA